MKYISVTYKIGILVSLLFWVGCKEDNKTYAPIQLNFSRVDVKVGVTALLQVSGRKFYYGVIKWPDCCSICKQWSSAYNRYKGR